MHILFKSLTISLTTLSTSLLYVNSAYAEKTLCALDESVVFSCSTGKKMVSVCASKDLNATQGWLQYRYGTSSKLDLVFPEVDTHPKYFSVANTIIYSGGGGGAYLQMNKGEFSYIVYSGEGRGWSQSGVTVQKNGKSIADILCKSNEEINIGGNFFEKSAIPEDKVGFEIPVK